MNGLYNNEDKTKLKCLSLGRKMLTIKENKNIDRMRSNEYLGVHVGYDATLKDAQMTYLTIQ